MMPNLPYDPERDFRPVTNLFYVIEGHHREPAAYRPIRWPSSKTLAALEKSLNFGTALVGRAPHTRRVPAAGSTTSGRRNSSTSPTRAAATWPARCSRAKSDVARIGLGNIAGQLGRRARLKVLAGEQRRALAAPPQRADLGAKAGLGAYPVRRLVVVGHGPCRRGTPDAVIAKVNDGPETQVMRENPRRPNSSANNSWKTKGRHAAGLSRRSSRPNREKIGAPAEAVQHLASIVGRGHSIDSFA